MDETVKRSNTPFKYGIVNKFIEKNNVSDWKVFPVTQMHCSKTW